MHAQAEAQDQHDQFHDLLRISEEQPIGLLAKYFGRRLFNQLLIVEGNEPVDVSVETQISNGHIQKVHSNVSDQQKPIG